LRLDRDLHPKAKEAIFSGAIHQKLQPEILILLWNKVFCNIWHLHRIVRP